MRAHLVALAVALCVACNEAPNDNTVLVGDWGTANVRVIATRDSVALWTPCMNAAFSGPVTVDAEGHFAANGTVTYSSLANPGVVHAHFSGITSGANIMIGFYTGDPAVPPPTAEFTLTPGGYVMSIGCD